MRHVRATLAEPPRVSFHHFVRQFAPGIMKVKRLDVNIGVESVLVVENGATSVMSHVEPICKNAMIDILRCLL